jgi:hypothetical protein
MRGLLWPRPIVTTGGDLVKDVEDRATLVERVALDKVLRAEAENATV